MFVGMIFGPDLLLVAVFLAFPILIIVGTWKLYAKADEPGWERTHPDLLAVHALSHRREAGVVAYFSPNTVRKRRVLAHICHGFDKSIFQIQGLWNRSLATPIYFRTNTRLRQFHVRSTPIG